MNWNVSDYLSLIALIVSIAVPVVQIVYKKLFRRMKIDVVMFGNVFLFYDSYGSYMQASFTIQNENEDITIKKIEVRATRIEDNSELNMVWGYMLPIDSKFMDERTMGKRAHPVKVLKDSVEPFTLQFYVIGNAGIFFHEWIEKLRRKEIPCNADSIFTVKKRFFWDAGKYGVEGKIYYNKNGIHKFNLSFNLTKDNELQLLNNVDAIIEGSGNYECIRIQDFSCH